MAHTEAITEENTVKSEKQIREEAYLLVWWICKIFSDSPKKMTAEEVLFWCKHSPISHMPLTIEDINEVLNSQLSGAVIGVCSPDENGAKTYKHLMYAYPDKFIAKLQNK